LPTAHGFKPDSTNAVALFNCVMAFLAWWILDWVSNLNSCDWHAGKRMCLRFGQICVVLHFMKTYVTESFSSKLQLFDYRSKATESFSEAIVW